MNQNRRKRIENIINKIENLSAEIGQITDEEEECFYNIPENLQGSDQYNKAECALDALQEAFDNLESVVENLDMARQ